MAAKAKIKPLLRFSNSPSAPQRAIDAGHAFFSHPMKLGSIHRTFLSQLPHLQSVILLFFRITCGWSFFLTGKGKLANLERTTKFFASLSLPAPHAHAVLVGSLEMIGGLMLVSGLFSRAISLPLAGTMVVAYLTAHRDEAFLSISDFTDQAPYSFLMATLFLFAFGAGRFSVDHFLQPRIAKFFSTSNIKS